MAQTSIASCPHCGGRIATDPRLAGQVVKCPHCQRPFQMPAPSATLVRWFVARNRQKHGPFALTQLQQMAVAGQLQPTDMLLEEGQQKWYPALEIEGLFPAAVPVDGDTHGIKREPHPVPEPPSVSYPSGKREKPGLVSCKECGALVARSALACPQCGVAKPGMQMGKLIVHRLSGMTGAMYAVQIMVDNQLMGEIANGRTVTLELPVGQRAIEVSGGGMSRRATVTIADGQTTRCRLYFSAWGVLGGGLILEQQDRLKQKPHASLKRGCLQTFLIVTGCLTLILFCSFILSFFGDSRKAEPPAANTEESAIAYVRKQKKPVTEGVSITGIFAKKNQAGFWWVHVEYGRVINPRDPFPLSQSTGHTDIYLLFSGSRWVEVSEVEAGGADSFR